jgi:hypothetical protein
MSTLTAQETFMHKTDITGGANPEREIYDNGSGRFADLKMSKKKLYYYDFREVCH